MLLKNFVLRATALPRTLSRPSKLAAPLRREVLSCSRPSTAVKALQTEERKRQEAEQAAASPSQNGTGSNSGGESGGEGEPVALGSSGAETKGDILRLGKLAFPILLQYITANVTYLVNTGYVGHLSKPELLSGLVLAASLSTATGYNIISGISTATETVCGQAYGAKNYKALNETLQRALAICAAACVPISLLWSNAETVLVDLGQPANIAAGAASYLHIVTPALLLYSIHDCVDRYLISQGVVNPSLIVASICSGVAPLFAWFFVSHLDLGLEGAGYAYTSVQALNAALSFGYLAWREKVDLPAKQPPGYEPLRPSIMALQNWGPYLALAFPAIISYCMEGWACEVLIFFAGTLDNAELAVGVTGITLQFSTFVWLVAASFASATSFTVGNKLGAGDGQGAKGTARRATATVLGTQIVIGSVAYHFKEPLLGLLSSNEDVVNLSLAVMPVLAVCFVADGLTAVQGGVLRGAGRQWWAAGLNLLGWWGVGVPLAYYLSHPYGANVMGLWGGFATAAVLQAILQFGVISRLDWDAEVKRSDALISSSAGKSE
ncbi:MATE efflux family protein [Dunaliella salina]|uniref:Protein DETOXIFICATION n=1 Tax=Dunaliella salina TaxID=3046 RepID=A0ABQ7H595_DUNSA|nr:MATE efflux family protein [Dunaliella salina]|eukprot:KAF5841993.1 MATE efflux family protein [Dunaliella salina]